MDRRDDILMMIANSLRSIDKTLRDMNHREIKDSNSFKINKVSVERAPGVYEEMYLKPAEINPGQRLTIEKEVQE